MRFKYKIKLIEKVRITVYHHNGWSIDTFFIKQKDLSKKWRKMLNELMQKEVDKLK